MQKRITNAAVLSRSEQQQTRGGYGNYCAHVYCFLPLQSTYVIVEANFNFGNHVYACESIGGQYVSPAICGGEYQYVP
jgi:hypothetical protein